MQNNETSFNLSRRQFGLQVAGLAGVAAFSGLTGCARRDGGTAYKKAFYSAHAVYGIDALGDMFEIFQRGGVIELAAAKKAYQIADAGLFAVDEIAALLERGLPANTFEKARTFIASFKSAISAGAIKFKSPKAESIYFNTVATVEVTINLIEAINAGRKKEVGELENQQKVAGVKAKAAVAQAQSETAWYQEAIVRGSTLASELSILSNEDAPVIWEAVKNRSAATHAENLRRGL